MVRVTRVLAVVVGFLAALGGAGVAQAADGAVTVTGYAKCLAAGVTVQNTSGADIEVRLYLDGNPAFGDNAWISVPNGQSKLLSGTAPASGSGTYTTYQHGPGDTEVLIATTPYTTPDYCDDFPATFTDTCSKVTVTVTNNHGSDATFTIAQTSGSTYPVATLAVPAGQTKSVDITITAAIKELGLYLDSEGDYLTRYKPKGLDGQCPSPSVSASAPGLPQTGSNSVPGLVAAGAGLVLVGVALLVIRRRVLGAKSQPGD